MERKRKNSFFFCRDSECFHIITWLIQLFRFLTLFVVSNPIDGPHFSWSRDLMFNSENVRVYSVPVRGTYGLSCIVPPIRISGHAFMQHRVQIVIVTYKYSRMSSRLSNKSRDPLSIIVLYKNSINEMCTRVSLCVPYMILINAIYKCQRGVSIQDFILINLLSFTHNTFYTYIAV